ncbi:MAG: S8 family serine peptidase [Pyrinomonadaceae bacterium]
MKAQDTRAYVEDELLVKYTGGTGSPYAARANRSVGALVIEDLGDLGWQRVKLPAGLTRVAAIRLYLALKGVEAAQPNFYYHLLTTPNDPQFTNPGMYGMDRISAPSAWDLTTGDASVVVANIDSGTRLTHQDLAANIWTNPFERAGNGVDDDNNGKVDDVYGWDFFYDRADVTDENGHGTHTAGTVGAVGNNGFGVVGVNWTVRIMTIKVYNNTGVGTTSAMLINAYNYIRRMKNSGINIRVTNNSYGGCFDICGYDQATKDAIDALGATGVLQVFAAGNAATNNDQFPFFPSSYTSPSILAVASSTTKDTPSSFTNFGANSVDLAAPGNGILSTTFESDSSYGPKTGSSMSAPHVTGAAALLSAYQPGLSAVSLKATLMNTVDAIPEWNGMTKTGGRLNIDHALRTPSVCTLDLASTSLNASHRGGTFNVGINANDNCEYRVRSNAKWIRMLSGDVTSGVDTVTFRLTFNSLTARAASISIGDRIFTVTQTGYGPVIQPDTNY